MILPGRFTLFTFLTQFGFIELLLLLLITVVAIVVLFSYKIRV